VIVLRVLEIVLLLLVVRAVAGMALRLGKRSTWRGRTPPPKRFEGLESDIADGDFIEMK
jgi:hypothetical protein